MKLFIYMNEIGKLECFSLDRGSGWTKTFVLNTFFLKKIAERLLDCHYPKKVCNTSSSYHCTENLPAKQILKSPLFYVLLYWEILQVF